MRIPSLNRWYTISSRSRPRESGSVAVEFALVAPIFLLLLFAAYELGIWLHDLQVITNASREAARLGIIMQNPRTSDADMEQQVVNFTTTLLGANLICNPGVACSGVTFTGLVDDGTGVFRGGPSGTQLTVRVSAAFTFPLMSAFTTFSDIPVAAQTIMVFE